MATIQARFTTLFGPDGREHGYIATWGPMANGDVGTFEQLPAHVDRAVQVEGTFGVGGNCQVQGTIDGVNGRTLNDAFGVPLDIASAKIRAITEMVAKVRPVITAGDGSTSLTVSIVMRKTP